MKAIRWVVAAVGLAATSAASAEPPANTVLQTIDGGDRAWLLILSGYGDAYSWMNVELERAGRTPFFCLPGKLAITPEQDADILRRFVKGKPVYGGAPAGLALLEAYKFTFPCSGGQDK